MRIAKEGLGFILPCVALAAIFFAVGWWGLAVPFLIAGLGFSFFFRDPKRKIPGDENLLVAAADGKVIKIETAASHPLLPPPVTSVTIFLSLFDVHITRAPLSGRVQKIDYQPGRFFPAYKEEASLRNESNSLFLKGEKTDIFIKQIAGVVARRIKCYVKENEKVARGQKIGLMYFGSRVEIYLPPSVRVKVSLSQKIKAGETIIGEVSE
jgi:phosphatidylserine decarboxylase